MPWSSTDYQCAQQQDCHQRTRDQRHPKRSQRERVGRKRELVSCRAWIRGVSQGGGVAV